MKGIVFSIKQRHYKNTYNRRSTFLRDFSIKRFVAFYGVQTFFLFTFLLGVVLGSISLKFASPSLVSKLDFLFVTNLENRLKLSFFDIFCSSFASSFVFIFAAFLLSFALWGMFALPVLCAFSGFGIGVSSAFIFSQYLVLGVGFYILVILPGTVLFLFAFICALKESFAQSINLLKLCFASNTEFSALSHIKTFLFRYFIIILFIAFSALVDMLLWVLFANMFNF